MPVLQCIHKSVNHLLIPLAVAIAMVHWGSVMPQSLVSIVVLVAIHIVHLVVVQYCFHYNDWLHYRWQMMTVVDDTLKMDDFDAPQVVVVVVVVAAVGAEVLDAAAVEIVVVDASAHWVVHAAAVAFAVAVGVGYEKAARNWAVVAVAVVDIAVGVARHYYVPYSLEVVVVEEDLVEDVVDVDETHAVSVVAHVVVLDDNYDLAWKDESDVDFDDSWEYFPAASCAVVDIAVVTRDDDIAVVVVYHCCCCCCSSLYYCAWWRRNTILLPPPFQRSPYSCYYYSN